ncbi:MAG: hypothetical protein WC408_06125 [Candidatus Micrarchaeia archaeon]
MPHKRCIWNRSLSASEIKQQYYSNLNKYAPDKWLFTSIQQSQPSGTHNYTMANRKTSRSKFGCAIGKTE